MGMKHQDEQIALQAIEFWSTVCETETEYAWEAAEVCLVIYALSSRCSPIYP